jgi:hypothetical protein
MIAPFGVVADKIRRGAGGQQIPDKRKSIHGILQALLVLSPTRYGAVRVDSRFLPAVSQLRNDGILQALLVLSPTRYGAVPVACRFLIEACCRKSIEE